MTRRIDLYTVSDLARAAGVSVRTLHHYDAIGLLKPAWVAPNGWRHYGRAEALRLQEILFYRQIGLSLEDIAATLDRGAALDRLQAHRSRLVAETARLGAAIDTLDATIAHLKGETDMTLDALYRPFSPETQADYETWLTDRYGAGMAGRIRQARSGPAGADDPSGHMARLRAVETRLVAAYEAGTAPDSPALGPVLDDHRAYVAMMWNRPCPRADYAGLAALYQSHPDFVARYEALSPGFSAWLPAAITAYAGAAPGVSPASG